ANRVTCVSVMCANDLPRGCHEPALGERGVIGAETLLEDVDVVPGRYETDFLAFGLLRGCKAEGAGTVANFRLRQFAKRELQSGEKVEWQAPEEVRLILEVIDAAEEAWGPVHPDCDSGVVAGRDRVASQHPATPEKVAE